MSTIAEIDYMLREWARQTRNIARQSGYAKQSPQAGARDHVGGLGSFTVSQFMQEGLVGDAQQVSHALFGDRTTGRGCAPEQLIRFAERIYLHHDRRDRAKTLAHDLGVSVTTFWQLKGNLHHWVAARVPRETNYAHTVRTTNAPNCVDEMTA